MTYSGLGAGPMPNFGLTTNYNFADPSQYEVFTIVDFTYLNRNRGKDGRLDLGYEFEEGFFRAVKAGARYERVTTRQLQETRTYSAAQLLAGDPTPGTSLRADETAASSMGASRTISSTGFPARFRAPISAEASTSTCSGAASTQRWIRRQRSRACSTCGRRPRRLWPDRFRQRDRRHGVFG